MKITLAQLNSQVGNLDGNYGKICNAIDKAEEEGSDLVIFSECVLTGYPPMDLLENEWFIKKIHVYIAKLIEKSKDKNVGILLGTPFIQMDTKKLYNRAILIHNASIIYAQDKTLLPTYDVFDERRWFTPSDSNGIGTIKFKDKMLGVTICEDMWDSQYVIRPVDILNKLGVDIMINISASPFEIGKQNKRYDIIQNHLENITANHFIYVNQVGGNDELIFDGTSIIVSKDYGIQYQCASFKEEVKTYDLEDIARGSLHVSKDHVAMHEALVLGIKDYFHKTGFKKAIIGLSGGIDSAVVAVLAVRALGKENVLGITMPSKFSSTGSVDDAKILAKNLGINFDLINIGNINEMYTGYLENYYGDGFGIADENIQARIRGNILMYVSNKQGFLLLSTGNKSEVSVGYCTLYGDMCGGLSVLSDIYKTDVYEIAKYINRNEEVIPISTMSKAPSAELALDQKDTDSLPPYHILDHVLKLYIEDRKDCDFIQESCKKNFTEIVDVKRIIGMVNRNEYKRRQMPIGLKVTSKSFGTGRKFMISTKWSL